ncbi:MAG: alanine racemase, partial [Gemmatimonadota bacterium]|nr:alanine racemase [Gemmatimonadota bacterium]
MSELMGARPTTFVAVDPEALAHNTRQVRERARRQARLMAVVKTNAYGHGLVQAARVVLEAGATWLGVSSVAEGVALREAEIDAPVLVFMPASREECEALVAANLSATVACTEHVAWLADASDALDKTATAHVYVDTGLSRMPA